MKTDVLGIQINTLSKREVLNEIQNFLDQQKQIFVVTPYSESLVSAQTSPEYKQILNSADFSVADGIGVIWSAYYLNHLPATLLSLFRIIFRPKTLYRPIKEKISGSNFIWDLARLAESRGESIFLLGGYGATSQIVSKKLKQKFPKLIIAGNYSGTPSERGIVEKINSSNADYLFVAFGPETQERWIYSHRKKLNTKLLIGLGGTFDYIAGKRLNTPNFIRFRGLEWLWRLITQPWRAIRIFKGIFGLLFYSYKAKHKV